MFDKVFDRVVGIEGGYQNSFHDRGNWTSGTVGVGVLKGTKYGLSAMTYPHLNIKNLTKDEAKSIYHKDWWISLHLYELPNSMKYQMFDASFHHGKRNAILMLQRAVGVVDDGLLGPVSLTAMVLKEENDLLLTFIAERLDFMTKCRTWDEYGKGWTRRIAKNLKYAAEDN